MVVSMISLVVRHVADEHVRLLVCASRHARRSAGPFGFGLPRHGDVDQAGRRRTSQLAVQFDVQTVWKGTNTDTITLVTQEDTAACGYPFEAGVEYVVYSYDGTDVGSLCSRTAPVELAAEDLAAFSGGCADQPGRPTSPTPETAVSPPTNQGRTAWQRCSSSSRRERSCSASPECACTSVDRPKRTTPLTLITRNPTHPEKPWRTSTTSTQATRPRPSA